MMLGSVVAVVVVIEVVGLKRVCSRTLKNEDVEEDVGRTNNSGDDTESVGDHTESRIPRTIPKNIKCVSVSPLVHYRLLSYILGRDGRG
jgi:hypothetical protein